MGADVPKGDGPKETRKEPAPSTVVQAVWRVTEKPWAVAGILGLLLLLVLLLDLTGFDLRAVVARYVPEKQTSIGSRPFDALITAATKANKPYVIESVTMLWDITDDKQRKLREVSWRTVYTVLALKDLSPADQVFLESYRSDLAKRVTHWNGTELESPYSPQGRSFNVELNMKANERRTFTTGVDLTYDLPFPQRSAFNAQVPLGHNDDYAAYPNLANDADYIGSVLIIVRSKTTMIRPARTDFAVYWVSGKQPLFRQARFSAAAGNDSWNTLSASWSYVEPGQEVGLLFSW